MGIGCIGWGSGSDGKGGGDTAESQQVVDFIAQEFDIPNDAVESQIEEGLELIQDGHELSGLLIPYAGRIVTWAKAWNNIAA